MGRPFKTRVWNLRKTGRAGFKMYGIPGVYTFCFRRADGIEGLENDCLLLGGLFAQTVYGKECLALAESIVSDRKNFKQENNIIPGTGPAGTALNYETYVTPVKKQGRAR